jgi:CDP-diacylglycerol--serine O-phosphatidyltransferase
MEGPVKFATIILVPLGFVLIAIYPPTSLMVIFGGYALSGPLLWLYRRSGRGRRRVTPRDAQE